MESSDKYDIDILIDQLGLTSSIVSALINFLNCIKDMEPEALFKTIVEQVAETLDCSVAILYLIEPQLPHKLVKVIETFGLSISPRNIKAVYLDGKNIQNFGTLRRIYWKDIKIIYEDNRDFLVAKALTFPLICQNECVGLISIAGDGGAISEKEKSKKEEIVSAISVPAGSLLMNALRIKKKVKEYADQIEPLEKKNKELLENTIALKNERDTLEKACNDLKLKRIWIASLGIFFAVGISSGVMWLVKHMVGGNPDGLNLLYSMAGFTAFFGIICVCFKLINEIKIGEKSVSIDGRETSK